MDVPVLRLEAGDLRHALEDIDPVELRVEQLTGPAPEYAGVWPDGESAEAESVLLEDPSTGARYAMPRSVLRLSRATVMVALAAGELLTAGETTVALLASGDTALFHLTTLGQQLPGVGHICLTSVGDADPPLLDDRLRYLLSSAGIDLSVVNTVDEAALGANLLITTGPGHDDLAPRHLARGALLVNTTGRDLPTDVVDHVDQIYVDDLGLLEHNRHRDFVAVHLRDGERGRLAPLREAEGWHRQRAAWSDGHRIEADVHQVITGRHPGRNHLDDVLLFELLGALELDHTLASHIHRIARRRGLGSWTRPTRTDVDGDSASRPKD